MRDFLQIFQGYKRFFSETFTQNKPYFQQLARKQEPVALVVGCSDSRTIPEMLFDVSPGQIFTVRNIANIVPDPSSEGASSSVSSALEYAIRVLQVEHVIVLGHSGCGGIEAFLRQQKQPDLEIPEVQKWITLLEPARPYLAQFSQQGLPEQKAMEYAGICQSLANLRNLPFVAEAQNSGKLHIHGLWFEIASGELHRYQEGTQRFLPLREDPEYSSLFEEKCRP